MARADEETLLAGLHAGEAGAFSTLVRSHVGAMRGVAMRLLRDRDEADEAVQEAFVSAFRALPRFRGESKLSTWLHRIVVNASLARIRSRKTRLSGGPWDGDTEMDAETTRRLGSSGASGAVGQGALWSEPVDQLAQREETRVLVRRMIDQLPENHRTVLVLRDMEELSTKETATLLGVSVSVVKTRLHRARLALRRTLEAAQMENL